MMSSQGPFSGAFLLIPESDDESKILKAAKEGNIAAIDIFLSRNPELVDCTNFFGHTPLMLAAFFQKNNYLDVMQYLLGKNAKLTPTTRLGKTVFDIARLNEDNAALAILGTVEIKPEPQPESLPIAIFVGSDQDDLLLRQVEKAFVRGDVVHSLRRMSNKAEFNFKAEYTDEKYHYSINKLLLDLYCRSSEFQKMFKKPVLSEREPSLIVKPKYRMVHSAPLLDMVLTISKEFHEETLLNDKPPSFIIRFNSLRSVAESAYIKEEARQEFEGYIRNKQNTRY
jgi:hypothetical protein